MSIFSNFYYKARWVFRKKIWKLSHVDDLNFFGFVNKAEDDLWKIVSNLVSQANKVLYNEKHYDSPNISKIIELGCANGRNLIRAKCNSKLTYDKVKLIGIDINFQGISEGLKKIAEKKLSDIHLVNSDICEEGFKNTDLVISIATLLYLDRAELQLILSKLVDSKVKYFIR
jgi:hypothetical protein